MTQIKQNNIYALFLQSKEKYAQQYVYKKLSRLLNRANLYNTRYDQLSIFHDSAPTKSEIIVILKNRLYFRLCTHETFEMACIIFIYMWHTQFNIHYHLLEKEELDKLITAFMY